MDNVREIKANESYDPATQGKLELLAAMLDDQLKLLKKDVDGLTVDQLEWQQHAGMNTVGMLLAHLAIVEVWWMNLAMKRIVAEEDADRISLATIGIRMDDDGLPAKEGTSHPDPIRGKTIQEYVHMLDNTRAATHAMLKQWKDSDLDTRYKHPARDVQFSIRWTLYHILEHFSGHYGQILLLKHLMRNAGVLAKPEKS